MAHRFLPLLILFAACTVVHESDDLAPPARLADLLQSSSIIDLTHSFDAETIYWPTADGFELTVDARGYTEGGYYYEANSFCAAEHGGTHLDAPVHFAEGGWSADQIPVERLIGPAVRIDVSSFCLEDADYEVTIGDFQSWEDHNGTLPEGVIVLLYTGFGRHWPHRARYLGTEAQGEEAVASLHFPGLAPEAARGLVENRSIRAIGLDTPSIDFGQSKQLQSHQILFKANIPAFENVAHLERLPEKDFVIVALPMKIGGGSGGPLRIVALVPGS